MSTNRNGFRQRLFRLLLGVRDRQTDIRPGSLKPENISYDNWLIPHKFLRIRGSALEFASAWGTNWGTGMPGSLTARKVETVPPGIYPDGNGLYLCVSSSKRGTWVFRFSWRGRRPEMGLGSLADGVGLAEARRATLDARKDLADGRNPIDARREKRAIAANKPTFRQVADALLEAKAGEWRNEKHREQWRIALTQTASTLRDRSVDEIDTEAVLGALKPLWGDKPETASRLRGRIEAVLDFGKARGHRAGENPARWRGHLAHLLPKRGKLARGHHAAMAYQDVPDFMVRLASR